MALSPLEIFLIVMAVVLSTVLVVYVLCYIHCRKRRLDNEFSGSSYNFCSGNTRKRSTVPGNQGQVKLSRFARVRSSTVVDMEHKDCAATSGEKNQSERGSPDCHVMGFRPALSTIKEVDSKIFSVSPSSSKTSDESGNTMTTENSSSESQSEPNGGIGETGVGVITIIVIQQALKPTTASTTSTAAGDGNSRG